jgi:archaellum component FlaG (FlaF/FlaG flagellin family)
MASIKAHTFQTHQKAQQAIELINQGEGIPVNPEAVTRTYTEAQENEGRIFIISDEVTTKYLGEPIEIEIIYPES